MTTGHQLLSASREIKRLNERNRIYKEALDYIIDHAWVPATEKWINCFVDVAKTAVHKYE